MYFLTGPRENLETMFVVAAAYAPGNGLDVAGFKQAFALWLGEREPDGPCDADEPAAAELLASARSLLRRLDPILELLFGMAAYGSGAIRPAPTWTEWDVIEAYVRELTLTLLWLDEHRYGHRFPRDGTQPEEILASFHDIVLAVELLTLRDELFPPHAPPSCQGPPVAVRRRALDAAEAILRRPPAERILAPRARALTALAAERLQDTFRPGVLSQAG